jgi:hypothetical protein
VEEEAVGSIALRGMGNSRLKRDLRKQRAFDSVF